MASSTLERDHLETSDNSTISHSVIKEKVEALHFPWWRSFVEFRSERRDGSRGFFLVSIGRMRHRAGRKSVDTSKRRTFFGTDLVRIWGNTRSNRIDVHDQSVFCIERWTMAYNHIAMSGDRGIENHVNSFGNRFVMCLNQSDHITVSVVNSWKAKKTTWWPNCFEIEGNQSDWMWKRIVETLPLPLPRWERAARRVTKLRLRVTIAFGCGSR